jgi:TetR/AcrR family transcriptional regulator, transcriptional repressor of aconitase
MYSYFKNKSDLFASINKELQDRHLARSQKIIESNGTDSEKITQIIDEWTIDAYRDLKNNVYANELLDGMIKIAEQSEKRFRKLYIESLEPITGKDVAELIVFSIKGLLDDRPPIKTLQKRIALLIKKAT